MRMYLFIQIKCDKKAHLFSRVLSRSVNAYALNVSSVTY